LEIWCWRRLAEIVGNYHTKNYVLYRVKKKDNILNTIKENGPNGFVTSCAGTSFKDTLLKEKWKGIEDKEEDVSSYWMTLGKRENTGS
jgi:hypothetical protein